MKLMRKVLCGIQFMNEVFVIFLYLINYVFINQYEIYLYVVVCNNLNLFCVCLSEQFDVFFMYCYNGF